MGVIPRFGGALRDGLGAVGWFRADVGDWMVRGTCD